ncbi:hypothetical protein U9M48_002562 [Paspalum notatum var. saurae]|uniref:CCHC-type domain-containing protein n=1 Tax=Paspalum notatum var. saurae TaxID=547442 RepID=A0AAQ3SDJ9_PASNO
MASKNVLSVSNGNKLERERGISVERDEIEEDVIVSSAAGEQSKATAMSSATADTYPESVGSCRPPSPTPPASPPPHPAPPPAPRGAPVRRQLDFGDAVAVAGGDLEDDDDFLIRAVDDIERSYNEAKRRAPPCVCGRGNCAVERDHQREEWMYVCSSQPKCKHLSLCKEVDLNPKSPPGIKSDPKLSNPCVINIPSTHVADAVTPTNNGHGACSYKLPLLDAFKEPPQTADNNIMGGKHLKDSPVDGNKVVQVGDNNANGSTNPVQANDDEWPFDIINDEIVPTPQAIPHAKVHQESPSMISPMTPYGTHSPMTPHPNDIRYWAPDCPKPTSPGACFKCGVVGHYIANCPQRASPGACFKCGVIRSMGHPASSQSPACEQPRSSSLLAQTCLDPTDPEGGRLLTATGRSSSWSVWFSRSS